MYIKTFLKNEIYLLICLYLYRMSFKLYSKKPDLIALWDVLSGLIGGDKVRDTSLFTFHTTLKK